MNGIENIVRMLTGAGFTVLGADDNFLYLEDPACPVRAFKTFAEYAWIILCVISGLLLMAWGIAQIRGIKGNLKNNFKNLFLVFGIISIAGPIMNVIYGGDLFGSACKTVEISIPEVNSLLAARAKHGEKEFALYEDIDIQDSGPVNPQTRREDLSDAMKSVDDLEKITGELDAELTAAEIAEQQKQAQANIQDETVETTSSQDIKEEQL